MKLTDFALIFIGVTLPIIIVVYINVSYNVKAQEQEMYLKKIIDGAIQDGSYAMKQVESEDRTVDYGYSGVWDKKVNVNAKIGVETFLKSLYNNFGIQGSEGAERYLQLFIPAIAIIDYNGVQVSSMESYTKPDPSDATKTINITEHALKPKRYYTYSYAITREGQIVDDLTALKNTSNVSIHTVEFTMDDYISHRATVGTTEIPISGFYITDNKNNDSLAAGVNIDKDKVKQNVVDKLLAVRKQVIADTVMKEMAYALNKNNTFAQAQGVKYTFSFPPTSKEEWIDNVNNIGMIAFIQGLSVGNKKLEYKAYGITDLTITNRYYLTVPSGDSKYKINLYHKSTNCPEYKVGIKTISPTYLSTVQQAAVATAKIVSGGVTSSYTGFSPCPICNP